MTYAVITIAPASLDTHLLSPASLDIRLLMEKQLRVSPGIGGVVGDR